ncbi:MAG TPA: AIR synthase related protein [Phycisphaerae bacterium]|nr:AIR synthase related protein [Phycisphaerae bacterium]HRW53402.1 AIR synthase related protein [Phycisphaerae bacterium]
MEKSEDNLIEWIANRVGAGRTRDGDIVGIGDDMAILQTNGATILTAADMLLDGVHFDTRRHSLRQIGRKALAVNLSDCAAMAASPWGALVSVALPADWPMTHAQELFDGIAELAEQFDCRIIGGDTNSWNKPLAIDVTILARPFDGIRPVERRAAQVGDAIYVTGALGGSLASHHLSFVPRVIEAHALAESLGANLHAMMDLSDGLSTDADRMAKASNVGMIFNASSLLAVASDTAKFSAANADDLIRAVVSDGEDFELLLTTAPNITDDAMATITASTGMPITRIGEVVADSGIWLNTKDGRRTPMAPTGWRHFQ